MLRLNNPIVLSTWSFGTVGNSAAWDALSSGKSALDAVERAANAVEDDPSIDSVGLGGLPDIAGEVILDAAIMDSPSRWGSVIGLSGFKNPSSIARRIMERFGRGIRFGISAEAFATEEGFQTMNLLTPQAHTWWQHQLDESLAHGSFPFRDTGTGSLFSQATGVSNHDTIGIVAVDSTGRLAASTSTSGLPLKPKGRIGDSALPGHGLYVIQGVGAVAATGTGELISSSCASVRILDALASGKDITSALVVGLTHIADGADPRPDEQAAFICLGAEGQFGAGALRPGFSYSLYTEAGPELRNPEVVFLP